MRPSPIDWSSARFSENTSLPFLLVTSIRFVLCTTLVSPNAVLTPLLPASRSSVTLYPALDRCSVTSTLGQFCSNAFATSAFCDFPLAEVCDPAEDPVEDPSPGPLEDPLEDPLEGPLGSGGSPT